MADWCLQVSANFSARFSASSARAPRTRVRAYPRTHQTLQIQIPQLFGHTRLLFGYTRLLFGHTHAIKAGIKSRINSGTKYGAFRPHSFAFRPHSFPLRLQMFLISREGNGNVMQEIVGNLWYLIVLSCQCLFLEPSE